MEIKYLLIMLLIVKGMDSYAIHSRSRHKFNRERVRTNGTSQPPYNATIDCPGDTRDIIWKCEGGLYNLTQAGYPWSGVYNDSRKKQSLNNTVKDALDVLNHVCDTADRAQACIRHSGIQDYCMLEAWLSSDEIPSFPFICQPQYRNENLLHSLQCLHDNRLLTMLYFRIGSQCGIGILDRIIRGRKNVFWYRINVSPVIPMPDIMPMLCLPKDVISTCVRVENQCGNMAAVLVQDYILYLQGWAARALESARLDPDICHHDVDSTGADTYMSSQYARPSHIQPASSPYTQLLRLAKEGTPGSALDSVWGRPVVGYLERIGDKICYDETSLFASFYVCLLSSEDTSARSRFNILQFSHQIIPLFDNHGSSCTRVTHFIECWKLLQETCGSRVRGLALYATLLIEGCKIQNLMDNIGCHWQDMLIWHYMEASRRTAWPFVSQASHNPMWLDKSVYNVKTVQKDLGKVISLLQPGVDEIASKCGREPAVGLRRLLHKISYLQNDALKSYVT